MGESLFKIHNLIHICKISEVCVCDYSVFPGLVYIWLILTYIHLCYQLTQAVELNQNKYNSICIYIDLLPELAGNTDVNKSREYTYFTAHSPSSVYQCKKAFLRNMRENCSRPLLKTSCMAVEFPMKVVAIFKSFGGILQTAVVTLFGIHSAKWL